MVLKATFNNISVISWRLILLVEETGVTGENYWSIVSHLQTLSHNVVSSNQLAILQERKIRFALNLLFNILISDLKMNTNALLSFNLW
jgi:hypothetical protein